MKTKKLHPLHSPKFIFDFMRSTGEYFPAERGTGRTTALALRIIAQAIEDPHREYPIVDHQDTIIANRSLAERVNAMVSCLGLAHITVKPVACTICFGERVDVAPMPPKGRVDWR